MSGTSSPWRRVALKAALTVHAFTDLGASTGLAVARNSLRPLGWRDRRSTAERAAAPRGPGRLRASEVLADGIRCRFEEDELVLRFLSADLVLVDWEPERAPPPWAGHGPLWPAQLSERPAEVSVTERPGEPVRVASSAVTAEISSTGELRFVAGGTLLRHELAPLRRGRRRTARFILRDGEQLSGLGEQAGRLDLRGSHHRLWNRDPGGAYGPGEDPLYCAIPVLVGRHAEGAVLAFYENTFEGFVSLDGHRPPGAAPRPGAELTFAGGTLRHYLAFGDLPTVLDRYSALTGRPPLPPRWALGYHQSRWGYRSEEDVREVARGFAREGLPLSAVHLDIDYMEGYRVFTVDGERFPDLPGLAAEMGRAGTQLVAIVDPAVKADPAFPLFAEGAQGGHFVGSPDRAEAPCEGVVWAGRSVYPDFTDPATRSWWAGQYRALLGPGIAGIWHDMNEPTSMALWGDRTLPGGARHRGDGGGADHAECHNVYGLLMDQAGWEAQADQVPGRRPFLLSRSGWAGLGRWAWTWTGDVESSWEGLRQQIATVLGLGLSGVPFSGSDIGGFSGTPSPELYVRWLELSVLMPLCRTHSVTGAPPREPWRFPEPYRGAIGRLVRFRYRLLPYLYTLAEEASRTGAPLVRPLGWPGPGPEGGPLAEAEEAFLLGDDLLVAPVIRRGATERHLRLPPGRWYRWPPVSGEPAVLIEGDGRNLTVPAPVGQPVVFVREGAVVPLDDAWAPGASPAEVSLAASHAPRLLSFHCFPDRRGDARGRAYDDAGDGEGPGRRDSVELAGAGEAGALVLWRSEGAFPRPELARMVVHGRAVRRAIADGREVAVEVWPGPASSIEVAGSERLTLEC